MNCYECGGSVVRVAKPNRLFAYRGRLAFVVPDDLELLTCQRCGEHLITAEDAEVLDAIFAKQWVERGLP